MQQRLLTNPSPRYFGNVGDKCYAAVDNAHGGETYCGVIDGKCLVDGKDGYVFRYLSPDVPGIELTDRIPAENLFRSLDDVETARKNDRSVQEAAVRAACSTPGKLVAFLISRAGLPEKELEIVTEQARALGLSGKEAPDAGT